MNVTKILGDCIEWAEATCDNDFTVAEFFDMLDLRGNDFAYAAMLKQLDDRGFFNDKDEK
jgi:hypothetical protein